MISFFRRWLKKSESTHIANKSLSLESVWEWSEKYSQNWETDIKKRNIEELKDYHAELIDFINRVERNWMNNRFERLTKSNQGKLRNVMQALDQLSDTLYDLIRKSDWEDRARKTVETLATPEPTNDQPDRINSNWLIKPLHYSSKLLAEVTKTSTPQ